MKKLLLLLAFASSMAFSQTSIDLSGMTGDLTLGQNCSSSQTPQEYVTTGDLNLNGYELELKNVIFTVTGNLNGGGEIEGCGQALLYVNGNIQNNPDIEDDILGTTLSDKDFTLDNNFPLGEVYIVYDILGKELESGVTDLRTIGELPKQQIVILKIVGYNPKKLYLK